jgi:aminoglycoside phosphotransferase (APT) family kinase protein
VLFDKVDSDGTVEQLVLRRDLADSPAETSVRDEFPALCDLHRAGLPVPEPLWLDDGSAHVAGPFLVSRRVDGDAIGDPAAGASADLDYDPTELLATTLARVHTVPLSAMTRSGLCDTHWDRDALHAQIRHWETRYRENAPGPIPLLDTAISWLYENAQLGLQPATVVHGDFGFYNMLVRDGRLAALVDWELVHVGSPAWDLAYVRDHVSKLGTYDHFLAAYTVAGGTEPPPQAIDYFQIFTFIRTITMSLIVLEAFNRGRQRRIPIVDVCQIIYPLHLATLADECARVSLQNPATTRA